MPVFFTRVINISIEMPGMLICFILSTFFYPVLVVNCILGVVQVRQSIQRFPRNLLQIIRLIHLLDSPKKFRKLYCYRSSSTFFYSEQECTTYSLKYLSSVMKNQLKFYQKFTKYSLRKCARYKFLIKSSDMQKEQIPSRLG